ncbi:hypothetical protein [Lactobacillus sp.]|uniref:YncE family protein n=1 Tax=Lactobacillus sp. TaxID=1591 RepID=UPI0025BF7BB4|nr:hypothetical protein [Lactobacillus sp.]
MQKKQPQLSWKFIVALILIVCGIAVFVIHSHQNTKEPAVVDNTSTRPASYSTKEFKSLLQKQYPDVYKNLDLTQKPAFYVIPGLIKSAAVNHKTQKPGIARDMDPQGLAIIHNKYLIISAYSKSKKFDSVLWVLNFQTGEFIKTIALNGLDHVGGIAYDNDHDRLWVATINSSKRAQVQSITLNEIENYNFETQKKPIKFHNGTNLANPQRTSYMTYHNHKLYVGYFDKVHGGQLFAYKLNSKGLLKKDKKDNNLAVPNENWSTYTQIQGISFDKNDIVLSSSYGDNNSQLLIFKNKLNKKNYKLNFADADKIVSLPPYLEQIIAKDGETYLLFESATARYRKNTNLLHMDRVIKIKNTISGEKNKVVKK